MAEHEHKPDAGLIHTPVEYLCGDPSVRSGEGTTDDVYGLKGSEGVEANGMGKMAIFRDDVTPLKAEDEPSESKRFKGSEDAGTGR